MSEKQESTSGIRDARKAYKPLKLVKHGHFLDVVKDVVTDVATTGPGSQLVGDSSDQI